MRSRSYAAWINIGIALACAGCWREGPPEIPDLPLAKPVVPPVAKIEVTEESAPTEAAPPPPEMVVRMEAPKPPPPPEIKPSEKPAASKPEPAAPKGPTIVGTWRLTEGTEHGQPMPPGMNIEFTFSEDGTMNMSMSMAQMPEAHKESGTYKIEGDQITINIQNQAKTGKITFESNTRAVLEVDQARFVLEK